MQERGKVVTANNGEASSIKLATQSSKYRDMPAVLVKKIFLNASEDKLGEPSGKHAVFESLTWICILSHVCQNSDTVI